jgi:hypothetical protein
MSVNVRAILILIAIVLAVCAWMLRYGTAASSNPLAVIVTDRWTGTVYLCGLGTCSQQFPSVAPEGSP